MHLRSRYLSNLIIKKRKTWPLVAIFGARQVGKSTLLRDAIAKPAQIPYFTLDRPEILRRLRNGAESFILEETANFKTPIIIDEAHKAPAIFDVLKVLADERRTRGVVIITGSVDFSMASGVRETLTGRLGVCRLYPFTVGEIKQQKFSTFWGNAKAQRKLRENISVADIETWITRGGMPGICWLADAAERSAMIEEWLQSVCYRDLQQLKGSRYDGALAREILSLLAHNPETSAAAMAAALGEDSRRISKHLRGLEALYVLHRVRPLKAAGGVGFDRFYLFDAAVAAHLGAARKTLYSILLINESLAQHEYAGLTRAELFHYASRGKTKLDLVIKSEGRYFGFAVSDRAEQSSATLRSLEATAQKKIFSGISVLAPVTQDLLLRPGVRLEPFFYYC